MGLLFMPKSLTPASAYIVPSDTRPAIINQVRGIAAKFGSLVQILTGENDGVAILAAMAATGTFIGGVWYPNKQVSVKILPGTVYLGAGGITIPASQELLFDASACVINCGGAGDAIIIDSFMNSVFWFGTIVSGCDATHAGVRLKPTNIVPYDGFVTGAASKIYINAIAKNANINLGYGLVLDATNSPIVYNEIVLNEINNFDVQGLTLGAHYVSQNDIKVMFINAGNTAWKDHGTWFTANKVRIFDAGSRAGKGLDIYGFSNIYEYLLRADNIRTANQAVIFEAGANGNQVSLNSVARAKGITDTAAVVTNKILPFTEGARVWRNINQAIPTGVMTAISFTSAIYDSDTMWAAGAPTRLTIRTSGVYLVSVTFAWAGNAVGNVREAIINRSGGDIVGDHHLLPNASSSGQWHSYNAICRLVAGDWLEACGWQDSGGVLDIITETAGSVVGRSPVLMAQRIG